jgi:hypothetical protein
MEISQGNDPIYRSMSREFSHPEDLYRSGTAIGAYQKHQLSSERLTTHQSTCTDRAVPPSLPHQQLFQSFQVSDLPISDLLTALQQFFIHFPAEFSFHNWIVSSLPFNIFSTSLPSVFSFHSCVNRSGEPQSITKVKSRLLRSACSPPQHLLKTPSSLKATI